MRFPKIGQTPAAELVELAEALRGAANEMLRIHEGTHEDVQGATDALNGITERLSSIASREDAPRFGEFQSTEETRPYYFPGAIAPRVHVAHPYMTGEQDGDRRFGRVRFDLIHEGPPGWVHGGHVAWFFDQALGQHVVASDVGGPTFRLEVTYRRGTPLHKELDYEIKTERVEGRKMFADAWLRDGDVVVAEAKALFVEPKQGFKAGRPDSD